MLWKSEQQNVSSKDSEFTMESLFLIIISVLMMLLVVESFLWVTMQRLAAFLISVLENQIRQPTGSVTGVQAYRDVYAGILVVTIIQSETASNLHSNSNLATTPAFQHTRPYPYIEDEPTFVGRVQLLMDLESDTKNVPSRHLHRKGFVYWITGIEGIGKSRFAQQFIEHLKRRKIRKEFLWFDCNHPQTLFEQFTEAAQANDIPLGPIEQGGIKQMYKEFSNNYEMIIIFDNVKYYADIEEYLPTSTFGKFTVIATCGYLDPELRKSRGMSLTSLDRAESKELLLAANSSNTAPLQSTKLNEACETAIQISSGIPPVLKDLIDFACSCAEQQYPLGNDDYNVNAFFDTWAREKHLLNCNDLAQAELINITDRFTEIMKDLLTTIEQRSVVTSEVQRGIVQILMLMSFLLPLPNRIPQVLLSKFLDLDAKIYPKAKNLLSQHFLLINVLDEPQYIQIYSSVQSSLAKVLWEDKRKDFVDFLESFYPRMQSYIAQAEVKTRIGQLSISNCIHALKERREKLNTEPEIDLVQCLVEKVQIIFPEKNIPLDSSLNTLAELFETSAR